MGSLARLKKACHVFPAKAPRAFCEVSALPPLAKIPPRFQHALRYISPSFRTPSNSGTYRPTTGITPTADQQLAGMNTDRSQQTDAMEAGPIGKLEWSACRYSPSFLGWLSS
jgi:hypothetical protein